MTIPDHTLHTLEFPAVRAMLARYASFSATHQIINNLRPEQDAFVVRQQLAHTREAVYLLSVYPDVTIGAARDVRDAVKVAQRGGVLDAGTLLDVARSLGAMRRLRQLLIKSDTTLVPHLITYIQELPTLPMIEERIERAINHDGEVLDAASAKLASLRSEIRITMGRVQERLQHIVSSGQYSDALQESIVTVRNGRYVVPVKASHKSKVKGLVHDQSGRGITLYIEPMVVVELNNKLRELQLDEADEIARILAELSGYVGHEASQISGGIRALADLDFAFAKAKLSGQLRAVEPEIIDVTTGVNPRIQLMKARHPLIDPKVVVPIDIHMPNETRITLITGPNTGGKTVSLKTTGLLALMAQSGLFIPAADGSALPIFGRVFADIGDEQSIEQSLSTFSSHLTNIIRILRNLDQHGEVVATEVKTQLAPDEWRPQSAVFTDELPSLILLDELGAGTDPVEGSALARAIIEHLLSYGVFAIGTTHYAELKAFAHNTTGVQNASVEFNAETLSPTYRLMIGVPGRSNALAIATRLGLDPQIIAKARASVPNQELQTDSLLAAIQKERQEAARLLQAAEEAKQAAQQLMLQAQQQQQQLETHIEQERQQAIAEIEAEVRQARTELRRLRDDVQQVTITKKWMEDAQQRATDIQDAQVSKLKQQRRPQAPTVTPEVTPVRPIQVGDAVFVASVNLTGDVVAISYEEESAEVQVGGFRLTVRLSDLKPGQRKAEPLRAAPVVTAPSAPAVALELDVRGMRASEACERVDRYVDDAYRAGLPYIRVIHGKGMGALRQALRDQLQHHRQVKSLSGGGANGGEGVTVVHLQEH
jgi:DNA mismatch repair protein MutS2